MRSGGRRAGPVRVALRALHPHAPCSWSVPNPAACCSYSLAEVLKENMEELGIPRDANAAERAAVAAKEEAAKKFAAMSAWERMQVAGGAERPKDDDSGAGGGSGAGDRHGGSGRRKPKLTKAQKKKAFEAQEAGRGYNWVDVVAHLRRTGQRAS